jgi:hypothetical protein
MMNRCLRALLLSSALLIALLLGWRSPAHAGPNAGGTLIVHDAGWNPTCDEIVGPVLSSCDSVDNSVDLSHGCPTWKVYAAFPGNSQPRLKSLRWGMSWDVATLYVGGRFLPDPASVEVVTTPDWPYSGSGVTLTYQTVQTTQLVALCTFVGVSYYAGQLPGMIWHTTPHPTEPSVFLDDSAVPVADPIADYGTIGFLVPGYTPCPQPVPVPVIASSWGRIKAIYRR